MLINIMQRNTYIIIMAMIKNKFLLLTIIFFLTSCAFSPGMQMETKRSFSEKDEYVYIDSLSKNISIQNISDFVLSGAELRRSAYKIGKGDQISITVWGLPELFPIANINPDQNLRRVDSNGNIYFPYVGLIQAYQKTQDELRNELSKELSKYFNDPQLDISIARFNSQKVYMLGEITKPMKINITDIPLTLSDALGEVNGLRTDTANGAEVFVIRQGSASEEPMIFKANLSTPAGFLSAGEFDLYNNDIIYVNASGITKWNRVVSQFFPFSTFLNSIDNLTSD